MTEVMKMEQVVNIRDLELNERQHARRGRFQFYDLLHGRPGDPGCFYMQLSRTYSDFFSPRHRHNFEQVRFQLEGTVSFGRDGEMSPGTVGYFPEGVYYGPQTLEDESYTLVLQFGGASGSGYMADSIFQAGMAELKEFGTFKDGVYRVPKPDGGSKNRDAYEAVWEHVHGRRLRYPTPRYNKPLFIESTAFAWQPSPLAGVELRHLGTFSECRTTLSMARLQPGAILPIDPEHIVFVVSGSGQQAETTWEKHSSLYSGRSPSEIRATTETELLMVGLPNLAHATIPSSQPQQAVPA